MDALGAEMMLGPEPRRVVEGGDGEVHLVAAFLEGEAERGTASRAIWAASDRRAVVPFGLALPVDIGQLHVLEGDRDRSGRSLAHPAMAEVGLVVVDPSHEAHLAARAAAFHPFFAHVSPPIDAPPFARLRVQI